MKLNLVDNKTEILLKPGYKPVIYTVTKKHECKIIIINNDNE